MYDSDMGVLRPLSYMEGNTMSVQSCSAESLKSALSSVGKPTQGNRNALGDQLVRWMETASTEDLMTLSNSHQKVFSCVIPKAARQIRADQLIEGMKIHSDLGVDTIEYVGGEPDEPGTAYLYQGSGMVFVTYHLSHTKIRYNYYQMLDVGLKWVIEHYKQPKKTFTGRSLVNPYHMTTVASP